MVVLSVAVVTSGKTLVARQFVEMTRLRVEGLLSAFPKLLDSSRDHTFIETETVRYVYQPMESLYLVVITNRSSNILEDLETLRLLAKVVQDCCQTQVNEELVLKHAFDIVFAFDEVISFGHRESVTLSQIKTYTEMDSHEEKLHKIIEQSKMNEARETAKRKQLELSKLAASQAKENKNQSMGSPPAMESISSGSDRGGMPTMDTSMNDSAPWSSKMDDDGPAPFKPKAPSKGMSLTKKKPGDSLMASLGEPDISVSEEGPTGDDTAAAPPAAVNPLLDPVKVDIDEKVTANLQLEGGLVGEVECVGQFQVTVLDASKADLACFKLAPQSQDFKYKMHPNLNKASHANNILEVREPSRAFRANAPAPLVKWRLTTTNESFLPISLSCWPTPTADGTSVILQIELTDESAVLEDVHIRFPAAPSAKAKVLNCEPGEASYDSSAQQVHWYIPHVDSDVAEGSFEFSASADTASLLPYTFQAVVRGSTKCPMDILECYHQAKNEPISYHCEKTSTYVFTVGS